MQHTGIGRVQTSKLCYHEGTHPYMLPSFILTFFISQESIHAPLNLASMEVTVYGMAMAETIHVNVYLDLKDQLAQEVSHIVIGNML